MEQQRPATRPEDMKASISQLEAEVLRLQHKLSDLHVGDYNTLKRAYTSLCQHVVALEEEARGMVAQLAAFETEVVPPELVAKELGVAAVVTFGIALVNTTVRALPIKQSEALGKGMWLLGGAYVLLRLTGGALAHMAGMFGRNARRKRRLLEQVSAVEDRIAIMSALQEWAEKQVDPAASSGAGDGEGEGSARAAEAGSEAGAEAALAVPPPRRVSPASSAGSPAVSTGSSAELVEMPEAEELEAAEAGEAGPSRRQLAASSEAEAVPSGGTSSRASQGSSGKRVGESAARAAGAGGDSGLLGLRAYVQLGQKK